MGQTPPPLVLRVTPCGDAPGYRTVRLEADGVTLMTGTVGVADLGLLLRALSPDAAVTASGPEDAGVTG